MLNQKPLVFRIVYRCPCLQTQNWSSPKAPLTRGLYYFIYYPPLPSACPIVLSIVLQSSCNKRKNIAFNATIQKALSVFLD